MRELEKIAQSYLPAQQYAPAPQPRPPQRNTQQLQQESEEDDSGSSWLGTAGKGLGAAAALGGAYYLGKNRDKVGDFFTGDEDGGGLMGSLFSGGEDEAADAASDAASKSYEAPSISEGKDTPSMSGALDDVAEAGDSSELNQAQKEFDVAATASEAKGNKAVEEMEKRRDEIDFSSGQRDVLDTLRTGGGGSDTSAGGDASAGGDDTGGGLSWSSATDDDSGGSSIGEGLKSVFSFSSSDDKPVSAEEHADFGRQNDSSDSGADQPRSAWFSSGDEGVTGL